MTETPQQLKLGKRPARHDPQLFLMSRYTRDVDLIPALPTGDLGHTDLVHVPWGMLGNDNYGDCVFAGSDHEHMLWNAIGGNPSPPQFSPDTALSDYSAVTGFNRNDPSSDQGTDMGDAVKYRRKTGIVDTAGKRHTIGAYVGITPGDATQLKEAIWLFGAAGIGFLFPGSAMDQFNAGQPWTVVKGAQIDGGHYVPIVGYIAAEDMFVCVTWGRLQKVAPSFLKKYMDEGYAMLSTEMLKGGKSLEGFDLATLQEDLAELGGAPPQPVPTPTPTPTPPAPTPGPTQAVETWWSAVEHWAVDERHTGDNKKAATASRELAKASGLL